MFLHKLLIILSCCCMDVPPRLLPDVPGSPRGPRGAARPTPACFSSCSQRSGLQLCPCHEDLEGGFLILFPLHIFFLMHFCQRPCYVVSFWRRTSHASWRLYEPAHSKYWPALQGYAGTSCFLPCYPEPRITVWKSRSAGWSLRKSGFSSQLREAIREVTQPLSNYTDISGAGTTYLLLVVHVRAGNGLPPGTWLYEILGLPLVMIAADLIVLLV